jgi:hypothetical protein
LIPIKLKGYVSLLTGLLIYDYVLYTNVSLLTVRGLYLSRGVPTYDIYCVKPSTSYVYL